MEFFLILAALYVLASWLERAKLDDLKEDYERWKKRQGK